MNKDVIEGKCIQEGIPTPDNPVEIKTMTKEEIMKICRQSFEENVMSNLDSSLIFKYVKTLEEENQQLKEQLQSKKQELNGFVTTIAKYLEIEEAEHTTYDEIIEKIVKLKSCKKQLKQRELEFANCIKERNDFIAIIEEAVKKTKVVKEYKFDLIGRYELLDILNKYKGDNNE